MNRILSLRVFLFSVIFILGMGISSYATHLRAGEIIVERVDCSSLTFRITITVFTNTINTNILFGGTDDWLDFGDGSPRVLVPETPNVLRSDLGEGVAMASYTVEHTYAGGRQYTISYSEPNRNIGVVNMDGSGNTRFYIETTIIVDDLFLGCNNTPQLLVPPIDQACTGVAWFHNPGAFDPDGRDSLSYELVVPFQIKNTTVNNYREPNAQEFYTNFGTGNETATGPPTFTINQADGTLTWDAPGAPGEYNIAFIIKEWRKIDGEWYSQGFVRRDMQILVTDCDNERPELIVPEDVCVEAGTLLDATIFGIDPDNDPVKIEAFSEIFNFAAAEIPATYTPNPAVFQPSAPPAELQFQWQTDCSHVKDQPYQVVFKVTDNSPTGSRLVTFKTWRIRVVGPAPIWVDANLDVPTRSTTLQWEDYICEEAEVMQVWRRVDSFAFEPDSCQTGMPPNLGYTLIASLNNATSYVDNNGGLGLASGAQYCYRLVAVFPNPPGGESYVSEEICIGPILADRPVITHVTVDDTDQAEGQITVRWREPFDADPVQFPPPYVYDVFRAEGFSGKAGLVKINPGQLSVMEFVDNGLDTENKVYNYRIVAYDANNTTLDTSFVASSVRLEAQSRLESIELTWSAMVPWSNQIQGQVHDVYRGTEDMPEQDYELIATVDPFLNGFTYTDQGQHNNVPLEPNTLYCYRVLVRGGYGNPLITEPLENFSQRICAIPGDSTAPCIPELNVELVNCEDLKESGELCDINVFKNTLTWSRPSDAQCGGDINGYRVYRSKTIDGVYVLQNTEALLRDTFYIDTRIESFAYCYKISAVDRSGNESELSEPSCNDNCPYYELPNVFTPGTDNCNNLFSAFSGNDRYLTGVDENGLNTYLCGGLDGEGVKKCARFVEKVSIEIFNRWGKQVYSYESGSGENETIYIDWDGRSEDGTELTSGVYYYLAHVTFDTSDPAKRVQKIKGWVHLLR